MFSHVQNVDRDLTYFGVMGDERILYFIFDSVQKNMFVLIPQALKMHRDGKVMHHLQSGVYTSGDGGSEARGSTRARNGEATVLCLENT
jgi:hypothetical protein